ncbi:hypothetical protein EDC04DRAFT_402665 [Pisolithus marmoratus]|nr:hypothetical protein EDC04DRAFT_402665 [Pisolithus marmoratus]
MNKASRVWKFRKLKVQSLLRIQCLGLRCNNLDQRPSSPKKAIRGILKSLPTSSFPIPAGTFYSSYVLPYRPAFVRRNVPGTDSSSTPSGNDGCIGQAGYLDDQGHETGTSRDEKRNGRREMQRRGQKCRMWRSRNRGNHTHRVGQQGSSRRGGFDSSTLYTYAILRVTAIKYVTARQLVNAHDQAYVNVGQDEVLLSTVAGKNESGDSLEFLKREEVV